MLNGYYLALIETNQYFRCLDRPCLAKTKKEEKAGFQRNTERLLVTLYDCDAVSESAVLPAASVPRFSARSFIITKNTGTRIRT